MAYIAKKTLEAEALVSDAKTDEVREAAQKIFEAFRDSDPGTDHKLEMIEASIASTFSAFKNAVLTSDFEVIAPLTERLLTLIKNRNRQPGAMKQGPGRSLRG